MNIPESGAVVSCDEPGPLASLVTIRVLDGDVVRAHSVLVVVKLTMARRMHCNSLVIGFSDVMQNREHACTNEILCGARIVSSGALSQLTNMLSSTQTATFSSGNFAQFARHSTCPPRLPEQHPQPLAK